MSIRFNHAAGTITSTNTASIIIEGGTPTVPRPLRLNASSIIMPNKALPIGEAGAVVFDTASKTLKYHNGISWVELLSQDDILAPVNVSLTDIYNQLANRVRTVTYSSSAVASASVSGTNLNIIFPTSTSGGGTEVPGLFTSSPPGSIMQYALTSGQSVASIREQLSGATGGQSGRNGTQAAPYVTKTGWAFADGLWWTWNGTTTVTKVVPNLNQEAYLKGITTSGVTKTDSVIAGSGTISTTQIAMPTHYHGTGMMIGLGGDQGDDGVFIIGKTWNDGLSYNGAIITGDKQQYWTQAVEGSDSRRAFTTTNPIYPNDNTTSHSHTLTGVDVSHFNVAMLYNIAEPSLALNQDAGDARYVLKAGDVMTGSLTIANSATVQTNDTNALLWFRDVSGGERAAIYHNSTTNTLRLRSFGGTEVQISNTGIVTSAGSVITGTTSTVNGRNTVREINGILANANGTITLPLGTSDVRLGARQIIGRAPGTNFTWEAPAGHVMTGVGMSWSGGDDVLGEIYYRAIQVFENGVWRNIVSV